MYSTDFLHIQCNDEVCYQGAHHHYRFTTNCNHRKFVSYLQYQNIVYHMNRIEVDLDDGELLVQIECTSLQLMLQPIVLHAKGCFVIDYKTMLNVLGGITTYMIFYIQFAPKFDPDQPNEE